MSYNGSGTFNINSTGQPVVTGTVISSSVFNALTADLATGLSTCITKDGQTTVSANIPMNSFKFTNLAAGTAAGDSVRVSQLQAGSATSLTVTGTNTYAATASPALTAYTTGNTFSFVVPNSNTSSCTLNIDSLGAKAITRDGTTALISGDLVAGSEVLVVYDGTQFQVVNSNSKTNFNVSTLLKATTLNLTNALGTSYGGTGLTSFTSGGVVYASSSSALATGSALTFDGTTLTNTAAATSVLNVTGKSLVFYNASASDALLRAADDSSTVTAIGFNKTDTKFYSSGSEQMRLTSTGLGIGTSSPSQKLTVANGQITVTNSNAVNPSINFAGSGSGASGFQIGQNYNSQTLFVYDNAASSQRLTLDSSGNLGIGTGTSSPAAKLESVQATSGAGGWFMAGQLTAANYPMLRFAATTPGKYASIGNQADGGLHLFVNGTSGAVGTDAAILDSSGNLGLGVTPSAWRTANKAFQFGLTGVINGATNEQASFGSNFYIDASSVSRYIAGYGASNYTQQSGVHYWYTAPSGTAGNAITFTQAMTLDASGNLGLGVTPSAWSSAYKIIELPNGVAIGAYAASTLPASYYATNGYFNGVNWIYKSSGYASLRYDQQQTGSHAWFTAPSGTAGNAITFTQAMTLDASGNLGIGTSSPAAKLDVNGDIHITYTGTGNAGLTIARSGGTAVNWFNYTPSGSTDLRWFNGADLMTLNSSGNLGLGVTPSAWYSGWKAFDISSAGAISASGNGTIVWGNGYLNTSVSPIYKTNGYAVRYVAASDVGTHIWEIAPSGTAGNAITFTQAMTLDASGSLLVGRTSASDTTVGFTAYSNGTVTCARSSSINADLNLYVYSTGAAAARFYVGMGGTVYATSTTITAISDVRLKENIRDLDDGLNAVMALKPRKFDWKAGKGKNKKDDRGWIAQEFEQVFPDMVDTWADPAPEGEEPYKAVNADLIPTLVKAIQEQQTLIQSLTDRITQLESK